MEDRVIAQVVGTPRLIQAKPGLGEDTLSLPMGSVASYSLLTLLTTRYSLLSNHSQRLRAFVGQGIALLLSAEFAQQLAAGF